MRIIKLDHTTRDNILSDLLKRDPNNYDSYGAAVQEIVEAVKARKDEAVFAYTQKFISCFTELVPVVYGGCKY